MNAYVKIDYLGEQIGEIMLFTDKTELMEFIESQMPLHRTVTLIPEELVEDFRKKEIREIMERKGGLSDQDWWRFPDLV